MPIPRRLIAIVVLAIVGACARHVPPTAAPASSRLIADTTLFHIVPPFCQTPKDSLTVTRDSATMAACQLRNQRGPQFKIF
jgi:hypothetical protein